MHKKIKCCYIFLTLLVIPMFFLSCFSCSSTGKISSTDSVAEETENVELEYFSEEEKQNEGKLNVPVLDKNQKTMASVSDKQLEKIEPLSFTEIWGYVTSDDVASYDASTPITDIGYFGAGLSTFGELIGVPNRNKLPKTDARVHLVIADNGRALTHFCLDPQYSVRDKLIADIIKATEPYDGLQIDFELVSAVDAEHFYSFLKELKEGIGDKIFSVAIPARTRTLKNDAYNYEKINKIVDRILVMAYDEHWSTSAPGPVASIDWCFNVAKYSLSVVPKHKLVMGIPFYGRAWADYDTAGAYRFSSVDRLFRGNYAEGKLPEGTEVSEVTYEKGIPTFTLKRNVTYKFYFDNTGSLISRMAMYKDLGVSSVGFWRVGQEDKEIWSKLKNEE